MFVMDVLVNLDSLEFLEFLEFLGFMRFAAHLEAVEAFSIDTDDGALRHKGGGVYLVD